MKKGSPLWSNNFITPRIFTGFLSRSLTTHWNILTAMFLFPTAKHWSLTPALTARNVSRHFLTDLMSCKWILPIQSFFSPIFTEITAASQKNWPPEAFLFSWMPLIIIISVSSLPLADGRPWNRFFSAKAFLWKKSKNRKRAIRQDFTHRITLSLPPKSATMIC